MDTKTLIELAAAKHGEKPGDLMAAGVRGDLVSVVLSTGQKYVYDAGRLAAEAEAKAVKAEAPPAGKAKPKPAGRSRKASDK